MNFTLMANLQFLHSNIKIAWLQRIHAGIVYYYNHGYSFFNHLKKINFKNDKENSVTLATNNMFQA